MTTSPVPQDPDATVADPSAVSTSATPTHHTGIPDPITGEPDAHPVGVGVGALSGGAAGAALGALAGPIGVVVGAAIGAIAGGLAGKEVAESPESIAPVSAEGDTLDEFDHPATTDATATDAEPLSKPLADLLTPHEDAFLHGGTLSGRDPDAPTDALDEFDRPHRPAPAAANYDLSQDDENPLPTASSGLITPDETSIFADSTTGESSILAESPFPASRAVSPGDNFAATPTTPTYTSHADTEHHVRTGAYYRYVGREENGQPGSAFDDWIAAEKELLGH